MDAEGDSVERLHTLLLGMTGRVDDDALNTAREMIGAGHPAEAVELLTGCLLAGRVPVAPSEQYQLRWVLEQVRSKRSLADRLHVVEAVPPEEHRFGEPEVPDGDIAEALRPVAQRLTGLQALWCVSRATPAGVTYGAVPRRVLLAEVGSEGTVTAVGYQLLQALRRAGLSCSVDVFETGTELPRYHHDALAAARRITLGATTTTARGSGRSRASRQQSGGERKEVGVSDLAAEPPARVPPTEIAADPEPPRAEPLASEPAASEPVTPEPAVTEPVAAPEPTPGFSSSVETASPLAGDSWFPDHDSEREEPVVERDSVVEHEPIDREPVAEGENNPRVPAAVDAKLTDRERNLLRKLHEELAQREQDSDDKAPENQQQESWLATMPGTGGFPPIKSSQQHPPQAG